VQQDATRCNKIQQDATRCKKHNNLYIKPIAAGMFCLSLATPSGKGGFQESVEPLFRPSK
jgi:hypothetical protein